MSEDRQIEKKWRKVYRKLQKRCQETHLQERRNGERVEEKGDRIREKHTGGFKTVIIFYF